MIKIKISILSNINVNSIIRKISKDYNIYKSPGYNAWAGELLNKDSGLNKFLPDTVFLILDGHELLNPYTDDLNIIEKNIDTYLGYIEDYSIENPNATIFISNLDIEQRKLQSLKDTRIEKLLEQYWHKELIKIVERVNSVYIFDYKNMVEDVGRNQFYSKKTWYLAGIKFSAIGEKKIIEKITSYINAIEGKRKKCLVLDLDNTLWGGVVGEEGLDGIELSDNKEGARYKDFQRRIKELKNLGIILTIVSKNNHADAIEVIKNHKDMVLREDDFILTKINWDIKANNIRNLAKQLNIGLDSFVFIDDNPIERESVKALIPEVKVSDFPKDSSNLENHIIDIYNNNFLVLNSTYEDSKKTEMYKSNLHRESALSQSNDFNDFLRKLETKVQVWKAREEDINRIVQLTQKTNQFNLTTVRYTELDIKKFIKSSNNDVYVFNVEDRFGDNGKVALIIVEKSLENIELDTFILSCRVMGRFLEDIIIDFIEKKYSKEGYKEIIATYIPTKRNKPVEELFDRLGYKTIELKADGYKKYTLNLEDRLPMREKYGELNFK